MSVSRLPLFQRLPNIGKQIGGALLLLEKGDGTLQSLFITPLTAPEYIWSKVLSLTTLALLTSFAIALAAFGPRFNVLLLFVGVLPTSVLFILIGIAAASRFVTLNAFLVLVGLGTGVFILPLLDLFQIFESDLFFLLPSHGSLLLIAGAFTQDLTPFEIVGSLLTLLVWTVAMYVWAKRWLDRYVIGSGA